MNLEPDMDRLVNVALSKGYESGAWAIDLADFDKISAAAAQFRCSRFHRYEIGKADPFLY